MTSRLIAMGLLSFVTCTTALVAQRPTFGNAVRQFVSVDAAVVAITHARVIDGTGGPARDDHTLVLRDGLIAAMGPAGSVAVPEGATIIDATGKSVIPGLVMVHEHTYYPVGQGIYGNLGVSFSRLYLAGGVTTIRTGGNVNGFTDLNLKRAIDRGEMAGPAIDATAPYLNGPRQGLQMTALKGPDDARRHVDYWADQGASSFKAYMQITRAELAAAIEAAHTRGLKVTGHLCSVTYAEAAAMGIDNIEHGFAASTDFFPNKQPDVCPGQSQGQATIAALDPAGEAFTRLVAQLVARRVTLTSTLTVFENLSPRRPKPPGLDVLIQPLKDQYDAYWLRQSQSQSQTGYAALFPKMMTLERAFAQAGGTLIAGTDPTGSGGVVPGYANQRQVELLVEAGFSAAEAIRIATLNGAVYLGLGSRIGSLAAGKQADLVILGGNPLADVSAIRRVETVFKQGIGYDPARLVQSVTGRVGLW